MNFETMQIMWFALIIMFIVIEMCSVALVSIWLALGGVVALIVSFYTDTFLVQFISFLVVSIITLMFTRPLIKKHLIKEKYHTNVDMVVGMAGVVTGKITPNEPGRVKVNGMSWLARSSVTLNEGETCIVEKLQGAAVVVNQVESAFAQE